MAEENELNSETQEDTTAEATTMGAEETEATTDANVEKVEDTPEEVTQATEIVEKEETLSAPEGTPVPPAEAKPAPSSEAEKNSEDKKEKKKLSKGVIGGIIAGAVALVVVIAIVVVVVMQGQAKTKYNEYIDNLESLSSSGLQAASIAEDLCNTTRQVWYAAIWDEDKTWDSDIEQYHASDFNEALAKLYADSATKTKISNMKSYASDVETIMDKLKNPPDSELEDAYDAAKDFADSVEDMVDLAADPSGSLQTYSNNFSTADDACAKALKKLNKEIPDKKK